MFIRAGFRGDPGKVTPKQASPWLLNLTQYEVSKFKPEFKSSQFWHASKLCQWEKLVWPFVPRATWEVALGKFASCKGVGILLRYIKLICWPGHLPSDLKKFGMHSGTKRLWEISEMKQLLSLQYPQLLGRSHLAKAPYEKMLAMPTIPKAHISDILTSSFNLLC